ncbi:hypothetical protein GCK32_013007 [Trichostrongylus colubriformis]|uniref:Uncharacterized protein n=1 Tax=Trichostrongylus colubriformis TaxID=6319 RepID=A0AAN8IAE9_TRICO
MNSHLFMLNTINRSVDWLRLLQCRRAYCLLSVTNYTNGLIIASWLFSSYGLALDLLFCLSSCLFGIAITGLYLNRPIAMIPDVTYKILISLCALFYGIHEADGAVDNAVYRLTLICIAVVLQFTENYVLFQSLSAIHLQSQQLVQRRPPPSYDQLYIVELCQHSGPCTTAKLTVLERIDEQTRPETPPPCYELAIETLKSSQHTNR